MNLNHLEEKILSLHNGLNLRPTLEIAQEIGELLLEAKADIKSAGLLWQPWVKKLGIPYRTLAVYMQCHKNAALGTSEVSMNQFLRTIKNAKRAARAEERKEARDEFIASAPPPDERYRVHHADCTKFDWPSVVDAIATDPPWEVREHYQWLGKFAMTHLREGGLLMVQCSTPDIPNVLGDLVGSGLTYTWMNAIVYDNAFAMFTTAVAMSWRPVLLLTKGQWDVKGLRKVTDTIPCQNQTFQKTLHEWQQPVKPWRNWLEALSRPGELIVDPFLGSGTNGVATKMNGARFFIGTEIDADHAKVAAGRIAETVEGETENKKIRLEEKGLKLHEAI